MKEQLKAIIETIKQACVETGLTNVTNDEILSDAIVIYINTKTFVAEAQDIAGQKPAGNPMNDLASDKQKAFLEQLGYTEKTDGITKKEASKLIEELKSKAK
jgi:hypothetical protein